MEPRPRVELYSFSADCWREIEIEGVVPFEFLSSSCDTIVKGEPNWSAYFHGHPFVNVVWFDVGKEVFRPRLGLGLPDRLIDGLMNFEKSVPMLGSTFWSPQGELEGKISLLVIEDDSSSWSKKFSAGPSTSITRVGCSKHGEIVQFTEQSLQFYNPKTQETSNIQMDSKGLRIRIGKFKLQVSNYTASLVPIRGSI